MTSSVIIDQLAALRDGHPESQLVVFVPRTQLGQALEMALARQREGWRGLRTLIPRHYAESVARIDAFQSGRREAPVEGRLFRAARLLQGRPEGAESGSLPGWHLLADTVARAIDTLREGGVDVHAVKERAQETASSDTLGVIASCYEDYGRELDDEGLYDDADVYRWATERVRSGGAPAVRETVYAVAGAADLSEHAYQFLSALQRETSAFVRLGVENQSEPPPETAAARFQSACVPDVRSARESPTRPSDGQEARVEEGDRFVRAVGAREEVRAVFRDLLRVGGSFGDATIAYASARPYAFLLADEAERIGIPTTMGTGLPAGHTRTGRALRGLYEWVREDYDPAILVRMLRSGLLRTDRWLRKRESDGTASAEHPSLQPHEAATLLAERSYESGREGLLGGLQAAVRTLKEERDEREDGTLTAREEKRLVRLSLVGEYVEVLTELIPRRGEVREMASNSCQFLERFGPTDAPTKPEEERTPDEAARALLYQRLDRLSVVDVSCEARDRPLAALFQQWLSEQYVQAEAPRPGHVHVLPLESAGYSDRSHLHVVGLDSTTFAAPLSENGMLQETDRRALTPSLEEPNRPDGARRRTPADEALWRAERALRRHRGRTCYYTRIFDVEAGEERDPSSLFLQHERASRISSGGEREATSEGTEITTEPAVVGLVPDGDAIALSEGDLWLAAYRHGQDGDGQDREDPEADPDPAPARALLRRQYPWIRAGEAARQARRSGHYTAHDGLLPAERNPNLDLFDDSRPLSASRLETLAEAPYVYFLKYVLGVRPLDEPALDDEPWLNHRRKGTLLHEIYERFMRAVDGPPTAEDESQLETVVDAVLEEEVEQFAPPSTVVEEAARRELWQNAALFLRSEIERGTDYEPEYIERGFGFPPHRREEQDFERAARVEVGETPLRLRGRIDRVDRNRSTGNLVVWDYKTGGASSYDEDDPIQDGKTLQWALYAYALEALTGETVEESGYFFATVDEVGGRISGDPHRYRPDVEQLLQRLGALAESGSFPVTPHLHDVNAWKWGGYDRLVSDLRQRRKELKDKDYPEDRPRPPSF